MNPIEKRLAKGIPAKELEKVFGKAAVDKTKPKKKAKSK